MTENVTEYIKRSARRLMAARGEMPKELLPWDEAMSLLRIKYGREKA